MVDEHGRRERRRHVPDVLEREQRHLPTDRLAAPEASAPEAADAPLPGPAPQVVGESYWSGVGRRRRWALVGGIVAALALAGGIAYGLWWSLTPREAPRPAKPSAPVAVPSEEPSASAAATASADATASATATGSVSGTGGTSAPTGRSPFIAYRAGGTIWISGEHGGSARTVYSATSGPFSLSPNGLTVAYVDPGAGTLRLIDVTTGQSRPVGAALPIRPSWAADSSFVVFAQSADGGHTQSVARVHADGTALTRLMPGARGRAMADGRVIAAPLLAGAPSGTSSKVAVFSDGRSLVVAGRFMPEEVCPAAAGVYFADVMGTPAIRYVGLDGKGLRTLVARPAATVGVSFSDLSLSPDGAWLVYTETGDDGYSRIYALPLKGGARVALTPRLDGYFMGWSASGADVFFVEGNAIQGEATRVSAVHPDGTGRRVVVEGGGL